MSQIRLELPRPIKKGQRGLAFGHHIDSLQTQTEFLAEVITKLRIPSGRGSQLVQITATIAGAKGYYQGRLQTAGATLAASANLAAAQLGTFATTDDSNKVVVCNLQELDNATSGHALSASGDPDIFACFEIPGMISSNAWSTRVVLIHGDQYDTDC